MNDIIHYFETRRSVAPVMLGGPAPSPAEVDKMLTIAARVPDHGRLVPWRFILIEGAARERIGQVIEAAFAADNPEADEKRRAFERKRLAHAPLVVGVVSRAGAHVKIPEWEQVLSAGAVCMNLSHAANALGYGASWLTEWYSFDRRVLDALGVAPTERMAGFVHIGRTIEKPIDRPRPNLAEIITTY
jgi:nitroreductase